MHRYKEGDIVTVIGNSVVIGISIIGETGVITEVRGLHMPYKVAFKQCELWLNEQDLSYSLKTKIDAILD